jgi:hypothetical protein
MTLREATLLFQTPVGLAPNATIEINLTAAETGSDTAFLVVLTFDQFHEFEFFRDQIPHIPAIRTKEYYSPSYWRQTVGKGIQTLHRIRATSKDRYYVGLIQTGPPSKRLKGLSGRVCLVNPGGQHLPLQEANFPEVFLGTAWAFFFGSCWPRYPTTSQKTWTFQVALIAAVKFIAKSPHRHSDI